MDFVGAMDNFNHSGRGYMCEDGEMPPLPPHASIELILIANISCQK